MSDNCWNYLVTCGEEYEMVDSVSSLEDELLHFLESSGDLSEIEVFKAVGSKITRVPVKVTIEEG